MKRNSMSSLLSILAAAKSIPGTAANRAETAQGAAEAAQTAAEAAAQNAIEHGYGVTAEANADGTYTLAFTEPESEG